MSGRRTKLAAARAEEESMRRQRDEALRMAADVAGRFNRKEATIMRLRKALRALVEHDSASGPCDVPGMKCDCYANAFAALEEVAR